MNHSHLLQGNHMQLKVRKLSSVSEAALRCSWNFIRILLKPVLAGYMLHAGFLPSLPEGLFRCAIGSGAGVLFRAALQFLLFAGDLCSLMALAVAPMLVLASWRGSWRGQMFLALSQQGASSSDGERAKQNWCLDQGRFYRLHRNSSEVVALFSCSVCISQQYPPALCLEKGSFYMLPWPWDNSVSQLSFLLLPLSLFSFFKYFSLKLKRYSCR